MSSYRGVWLGYGIELLAVLLAATAAALVIAAFAFAVTGGVD